MNPYYNAYQILEQVYEKGARVKIALSNLLENENRAFTVKTVYGVLEHDGYLSLCVQTFAQKTPKRAVRMVLKIALYQIIFLQKPRYDVTNLSVELVKKLGKGGMAGFVNAFLRTFNEEKVTLPEGLEGLAVKYNYPLFAVERVVKTYGERAESIFKEKSHGVFVRFERGMENYLSLPHEDTPFENLKAFENFTRDEGFSRGDYTFQSVGSVAVCSVVESCENFLDACAAPGGKSVLLSKKCGSVTSCDIHGHRVKLMESYFARMGVTNAKAREQDSSAFYPPFEEAFDGVLCDVPCSGLGTINENPDLSLRLKEEDIESLNKTQLSVLSNCARYVKKGGALYYATCSVLQEENDLIAGKFLNGHPGYRAEEISCPLPFLKCEHGVQFLPDEAMGAGFYVSKLRKL